MPVKHAESGGLNLARVLLVDDDVASRLTLQTVLSKCGYWVDVASCASEAVDKLDDSYYDLVLTDLGLESPEAGLKVLSHARLKEYRPATAMIRAYRDSSYPSFAGRPSNVVIETEGVPQFVDRIAELIGLRATRRVARAMRHSTA